MLEDTNDRQVQIAAGLQGIEFTIASLPGWQEQRPKNFGFMRPFDFFAFQIAKYPEQLVLLQQGFRDRVIFLKLADLLSFGREELSIVQQDVSLYLQKMLDQIHPPNELMRRQIDPKSDFNAIQHELEHLGALPEDYQRTAYMVFALLKVNESSTLHLAGLALYKEEGLSLLQIGKILLNPKRLSSGDIQAVSDVILQLTAAGKEEESDELSALFAEKIHHRIDIVENDGEVQENIDTTTTAI